MQYEEYLELAALSALNSLDENETLLLETAIADFPELSLEVRKFQEAVTSLAYSAPPVPMAVELKQRLFQRIHSNDIPPSPSVCDLTAQATEVNWEPLPQPGVMIGKLFENSQTREIGFFVNATEQTRFSNHKHARNEEIVVLAGSLIIDGKTYVSGDRIYSSPDTIHQPETPTGCLIFVKTSLDDEIIAQSP
ncbi:cupin domain-containing protein [Calothrix sp. 336/3]|uniref:cupin domain-containing protein n=1 Tax=Calothrix sp. 336/3 TaxID=1337936 RepID=UPI0004E39C07|nr:cupin domain-containing protein [Calothrix sp. 336/3]AKG20129.1 hypothetical protein IJ00_01325 [Calothrix sp. 336/3]